MQQKRISVTLLLMYFTFFLWERTYMCVNTLCYLAFRHCQDFLRQTKAVL